MGKIVGYIISLIVIPIGLLFLFLYFTSPFSFGTWILPLGFLFLILGIISIIVSARKKKRGPKRVRATIETKPIPIDSESIFISYATVDSDFFQIPKITKILTNYPEIDEVLYWESDMHDDIYEYMDENLRLTRVVLLFCSKNSLYSDAVKMEWRSALKMNKKIIPVFIEPDDIPPLLTTKLGVKFNEKDPYTSIEEIYQMLLTKLEIESFRSFTDYVMPKRIKEQEFDLLNPESIEKSIGFDSDMPSNELLKELVYILQDNNFHVPGKQWKADEKKRKKKEVKTTQEISDENFVKINGFSELKDDKEHIGLFFTIQKVTDSASKVFLKAKGQREWILNEVLEDINLKCMELKETNEIIRTYSEQVQSLMDKVIFLDRFLHKHLGSDFKQVNKLVAQFQAKEIGKEDLIINGSQLVGKKFMTVFIDNIPVIYQMHKKSKL